MFYCIPIQINQYEMKLECVRLSVVYSIRALSSPYASLGTILSANQKTKFFPYFNQYAIISKYSLRPTIILSVIMV